MSKLTSVIVYLLVVPFAIKAPVFGIGVPYLFTPLVLKYKSFVYFCLLVGFLSSLQFLGIGRVDYVLNVILFLLGYLANKIWQLNRGFDSVLFYLLMPFLVVATVFITFDYVPPNYLFSKDTDYILPFFAYFENTKEYNLLLGASDPNNLCAFFALLLLFSKTGKYFYLKVLLCVWLAVLAKSTFFIIIFFYISFVFLCRRYSGHLLMKIGTWSLLFAAMIGPILIGQHFNIRFLIWGQYFSLLSIDGLFLPGTALLYQFSDEMPLMNYAPHNTLIDFQVGYGIVGLFLYLFCLKSSSVHNKLNISQNVFFSILILIQSSISLIFTPIPGFFLAFLVYGRKR
jgi:hypothetical protein